MQPPFFSSDDFFNSKTVIAGVGASWSLPEINENQSALKEILVEPDFESSLYITFDEAERRIDFNDDPSS